MRDVEPKIFIEMLRQNQARYGVGVYYEKWHIVFVGDKLCAVLYSA